MPYATRSVGPSTEWREDVAPDEGERFERHAETLRAYQRHNDKKAKGRALHRKQHAGLRATLTVRDDVPAQAAAGLFATPGAHDAFVRLSNGLGAHQPDWMPDVRGLAVKVLGVPGKKLIPGLEDAQTQDFLLINTQALPFANVDDFIKFVKSAESQALAVPRLLKAFGPARTAKLLRFLGGMKPPPSLAAVPYYTGLPLAFGAYAGKLSLVPEDTAPGTTGRGGNRLGAEIAERVARGPVRFAMRAQLYTDPQSTPIEDSSIVWDAPWVDVATLEIPQQDSDPALAAQVAQLSFDPWHALEAHRPLGNMMRARNNAYRMSTQERGAAPEPVSV